VFLDRDGTLNRQIIREGKPFPPATLGEFELFPGVPEGCRALQAAGFALIVVTNQPDVGRGQQPQSIVELMHERLLALVPEIERIEVCYAPGQGRPHPDNRRRKPETGMITDAAAALGLDLSRSWMIGDRWRDIDCGKRAGLRTIFIDFGYAEELREQPDIIVKSFPEAVEAIRGVGEREKGEGRKEKEAGA
jgi:D-glycero-D-manno-heptose 1,7-bisphosphate phosphatase